MAATGASSGSASGVRAGKAFVELSLKDIGVMNSLKMLEKQFKALGKGMMGLGAGAAAGGLAIIAPFAALTKTAIDSASAIKDVSEQLGVTTDEVQQFQYALGLSGGSAEDVVKAFTKLRASGAGGTITEMFSQLAEKVKAASTEGERYAIVSDVVGDKVARKLMPALKGGAAGVRELFDRANKTGIIKQETIDQLDEAGDALFDIGVVLKSVTASFASSLLGGSGGITQAAANFVSFGNSIRSVIERNGELIRGIAIGAAGFVALGAVLATVGAAFIGISAAMSAVAFLLSPAGLISVGLAALSAGLVMAAQDSTTLGDSFDEAWGGITDALSNGEIELAAEIAFAAISLEWTKVVNEMTREWRNFKDLLSFDPNKSKTIGGIGTAVSLLGQRGIFQSIWEDFQVSALGRSITTSGGTSGMRDILDAQNELDRQIEASRIARDADLQAELDDKKAKLAKLREKAGAFTGGGGDWGDDSGGLASAISNGVVRGIASVTGGAFAGSALNIGRERTVADDIKKSREAQEKLVKLFEKSPPLVWGD